MNEDNLLREFDKLVKQCRKNICGDSPSRDDVIIVFASEYLQCLKKLIAEKDNKLDIAMTRNLKRDEQVVLITAQLAHEVVKGLNDE